MANRLLRQLLICFLMKQHSIYNFQFWLLCLSSYLFFVSFNMIVPELPRYLTSLGGEEYKGLIISLFTLTAGLSRPFSGKLTDKIGRIPVMIFGSTVCFVMGFIYPVISSVAGFLLLRFLHGFSTGFKPTGTTAYLADLVPLARRGEAMGVLGISGSLGMASGPTIGNALARNFSLDVMFYCSSIAAVLSILVLIGMKETLEQREKFRPAMLRIYPNEIIEPRVIPACVVLMLTAFSFGTILTVIPDFSDYLGVTNRGVFFSIFTVASLFIRIIAGRASDIYGRVPILRMAAFVLAAGMTLIGFADSTNTFYAGALLFGIGNGMSVPTIFAWAVDLSDEKHRGKGMATVFIALEIGIGVGALVSGWLYNNQPGNFPITFWVPALLCLVGMIYLLFQPVVRLKKAGV